MLIVYCDACGLRIQPQELESGAAIRRPENNTALCAKCAAQQTPRKVSRGSRPIQLPVLPVSEDAVASSVLKRTPEQRVPAAPAPRRTMGLALVGFGIGVAVLVAG